MLKEVEVYWIARYDYKAGWKLPKHSHNFYQIIFIIEGDSELYIDKNVYETSTGNLFLLKPGYKHGLMVKQNSDLKTIDIKFMIDDSLLREKIDQIKSVYNIPDIKYILEKIKTEGLSKKKYYHKFSSIYLMEILLTLLRNQNGNKNNISNNKNELVGDKNNPVCSKFIEFISDNYEKDLSLKQISKQIGYNPSYICQKFKKVYNTSPMKYLYQFRINKAKELIIYSDYSLKQIAAKTGFKTIHHFTRLFHKNEGKTPGEFRDKEKEGIRKDIYLNKSFENKNLIEKE